MDLSPAVTPTSSSDSVASGGVNAKTAADLKGLKNLSPLLTEPKVPLGTVVVMGKMKNFDNIMVRAKHASA